MALTLEDRIAGKSSQLKQVLLRRLADGGYAAGDIFSSSGEIAAEFDLALGTVRRALNELIDEGYLESKRGVGYVVLKVPELAEVMPADQSPVPMVQPGAILFLAGMDTDGAEGVLDRYLQGIYAVADEQGVPVHVLRNTPAELSRALAAGRPAGVVAYGLERPLSVAVGDVPVVVIGDVAVTQNQTSLIADIEVGVGEAFKHLLGLGHERVMMLTWSQQAYPYLATEGYVLGMRQVFAQYGAPWRRDLVEQVPDEQLVTEGHLLEQLMSRGVTAVFCPSYRHVIGLYRQAHRLGVQIGKEFSVVGYGQHAWMQLLSPALTYVGWDPAAYGREVVRLLCEPASTRPSVFRGQVQLHRGMSVASLV